MLLPLWLNVTLEDEIKKCKEEDQEFIVGVTNKDIDNTIEEFWDSVQTKINVMDIMGISSNEIYKGLNKHLEKMDKRGYRFKAEEK